MKIRQIEAGDAEKFLRMLKKLDSETEFMMYEPGERRTTLEEQREIIERVQKNGDPVFLVENEEEIVGFLGGRRGTFNRVKHTVYIAMGIVEGYRGQGIGRKLMEQLDRWNVENDISRSELTVMCHNERAVSLYEGMGYQIEGRRKKSLLVDGRFVDEYYMGKTY
ncbi:GCN5 family N-acetyltransferase [Propionigenium maris DSM 9537]|uniref:GCN5 family N-acetyltransferase n=1 Tax=Propionigenium maris DSM 9537 TaxID=1123000 RepID=A0A9W6GLU2_9FUSO|nr:GNAT family N-acetyltransferase [Propionigenium maris]GLI55932.1 GCN5 family N-acetyltransferase [Propionigenium maris DSM 9537]